MEFTARGGSVSPQASPRWWIEEEGQWLKAQGGRLKEGTTPAAFHWDWSYKWTPEPPLRLWLGGTKTTALNKMGKYSRFHPSAGRFLLLLPENVAFTAKETKDGVIIWSCTLLVVASVKRVRTEVIKNQRRTMVPQLWSGGDFPDQAGLEDGSGPYLGHLRSWSQQVANKLLLRICEAVSNSHCMKDSFINTFFSGWSILGGKVQGRGRIFFKKLT